MAREKALLGEDANQFAAYAEDGDVDDDLLGGGGSANAASSFENQFPDIMNQNEVRPLLNQSSIPS